MAIDLADTLSRIVRKAESLTDRYEVLSEAKQEADARIAELEDLVSGLEEEVRRLKAEVEYLTVVNVISPTREDIDRSRAKLSGLVQEINKCIADLTE
ncbi:hypothetical protein [uncultured Muribaculum sp.]|uniref:hypothetical protein n=1 Tax=uncultured Muribaculum sp. TaxID=1918613 RepID=UPI002592A385|nr:hypothetical protein [uncultured Muribaculum sp.]